MKDRTRKKVFAEGAPAWARGEIAKKLQESIVATVNEVITQDLVDDWFLEDEAIGKQYAAIESMVLEDMSITLDLDAQGEPILALWYGEMRTPAEGSIRRFTPDDAFQIDGKCIRWDGPSTEEDREIARRTLDAVRAWKIALEKLEAEIIAAGAGS